MKICYLGSAASPIVRSWAEHFSRDHEVHLLTDTYRPIDGVNVHKIGRISGLPAVPFMGKVLDVRHYAKTLMPDVFHAFYVFGYGTMAVLGGAKPLIVTAMGSDIGSEAERSPIVRLGVRYTMRHAAYTAVKDPFADQRAADLGCPEGKSFISRSCCDTSVFTPDKSDYLLRRVWGSWDRPAVIYTRPFSKYYHSTDLAVAIPEVVREVPNVKFVFVDHGDLIEPWKLSVAKQPWKDNVVFVPRIPHEEMPRYLASAQIYVDTFYPEPDVWGHGHGTGLIEAMSCGCATVVPNRDEYGEDWCVSPWYVRGNPTSLSEILLSLLGRPDWRRIIGVRGREAAVENFDQEKVMGGMLRMYKELAGLGEKVFP